MTRRDTPESGCSAPIQTYKVLLTTYIAPANFGHLAIICFTIAVPLGACGSRCGPVGGFIAIGAGIVGAIAGLAWIGGEFHSYLRIILFCLVGLELVVGGAFVYAERRDDESIVAEILRWAALAISGLAIATLLSVWYGMLWR